MTAPSIDIVIRSYYRDLRWLALSLRSIDVFASGYRRLIVVVPESTVRRTGPLVPPHGQQLHVVTCEDFRDDYLGQQITKLHADEYSDADVIVHMDSDNVLVRPCDLRERYLHGDRVRMTYDTSGRRPVGDGFRSCPRLFFGAEVPHDLSGAPPAAFPRHLYQALRDHCQHAHGVGIADYAHAAGSDRFCEFGLLRALAWLQEPARYEWVDTPASLVPECRTFWSRSTNPDDIAGTLPASLRPPSRP